jgi:hypothetical protein
MIQIQSTSALTDSFTFTCRLDAALDLEYDITKQYTGSYFEEEIKGLADASGADEKTVRRIHMIGELTYG